MSDQTTSVRRGLGFLLADSAVYGGVAAISKASALITFPLLARSYSVADYGIVDFFLFFATLGALLIVFGQDSAVGRFYWQYDSFAARRQVISQVFVSHAVLVTLALIPALAFRDSLGPLLLDVANAPQLFALVALQIPCLVFINFCRNLLKWSFRRRDFVLHTLGGTVLQTATLIAGVILLGVPIEGVLLIYAASNLLLAGLGIWMIREWLTWPDNFSGFDLVLRYAVPLGAVAALGSGIPMLERGMVSKVLDLDSLGLLAAGTKVAMFVTLIVGAFQTAWGPFYMSQHKREDHAEIFDRVFRLFSFGVCVMVLLFCTLVVPLLHLLASERFVPAYEVAALIALALGVQSIGWITEIGVHISLRTRALPFIYAVGFCGSLLVLWLGLPVIGLLAAGLSTLMAHNVVAVGGAILAWRLHPIAFSIRPVMIMGLATAVCILIGLGLGRLHGPESFALVTLSGAGGLTLLGPFILLQASERRRILSYLTRK